MKQCFRRDTGLLDVFLLCAREYPEITQCGEYVLAEPNSLLSRQRFRSGCSTANTSRNSKKSIGSKDVEPDRHFFQTGPMTNSKTTRPE